MNITPTKSLVLKSLAGMIPGIAIAGAGTAQLGKSFSESTRIASTDLVDPKKVVKKYDPNIVVLTKPSDIDKVEEFSKNDKAVAKNLLRRIAKVGNAGYLSTNKNKYIFSSPMVNRSLLGHELGHRFDTSKGKREVIDAIFQAGEEERAWKSSPFQDKESQRIAKVMAGTYKGKDKIMMGGIAAGIGALGVPVVMKALKAMKK